MVVVSGGFHKLHLPIAAAEANSRGLLSLAITGIYPTHRALGLLRALRLAERGRIARLQARAAAIPEDKLRPLFAPELLDEAARALAGTRLPANWYDEVSVRTWRLYGREAARAMRHARGARLLHFRAGFGGASIDRARALGMVVLCDQALVHPALLAGLVENRGRLADTAPAPAGSLDAIGRTALADIDRSDVVLANSDFVKDTLVRAGWPPDRVRVVYLGVDDAFFALGHVARRQRASGPLRLVYASVLSRRKGADVLLEALARLGDDVDWRLTVAGPVDAEIRARHTGLLASDRVELLGPLTRADFKRALVANPVFVFPTFAEGSARAVFDALCCGCYAITTPNAGSIVEDGIHGALVPPGDADALAAAIVTADRDRRMVADIGNRNAEIVARRHRQVHYGEGLAAVYSDLTATA
jgi:glycosyltransferase involved in cell wall biosynthesis